MLLLSVLSALLRPAVAVPTAVVLGVLLCLYPGRRCRRMRMPAPYFAHRGLHAGTDVPENTPAAFALARQAGFGVELDLRLTADGETAIFHDPVLRRLCGRDDRIETLAADTVGSIPVLGSGQNIPLLRTALASLGGAPLLCDIKGRGIRDRIRVSRAAWPLLHAYPGEVLIESFDPFVLLWFRIHQPQVRRGLLATTHDRFGLPTAATLLFNILTRPDFIAYNCRQHRSVLFLLCRWLYRPAVIGWTVTDRLTEEKNRSRYDAFIFEQYDPRSPV